MRLAVKSDDERWFCGYTAKGTVIWSVFREDAVAFSNGVSAFSIIQEIGRGDLQMVDLDEPVEKSED